MNQSPTFPSVPGAAAARQLGLDLACQRWNKGRASYRPAGEVFDPRWASVEPISDREARAYVEREHYSHSYVAARFRAGIFIRKPFEKERLCGVGVFSVPMNGSVIPAYFPDLDASQGCELGRLVLADELAANAESWALARMKKLLHAALPDVRGVVAYCDPLERRDVDGTLVKRGHLGTIYRASNCEYRGRSSPRTLWLAPSGESLADRTLGKVRLEESGCSYVMAKLRALGAPARKFGESGADYIARLKSARWLRPLRHPGNHAFCFRLGTASKLDSRADRGSIAAHQLRNAH